MYKIWNFDKHRHAFVQKRLPYFIFVRVQNSSKWYSGGVLRPGQTRTKRAGNYLLSCFFERWQCNKICIKLLRSYLTLSMA